MSFFSQLRDGLHRTARQLKSRLDDVARQDSDETVTSATVAVATLEALEEALIQADVGVGATERIVAAVRERLEAGGSLLDSVKKEILAILESAQKPVSSPGASPRVVLVVGVNGTGKTTTVGKLAWLMTETGLRPMICAADTFRAAAVEQLEEWARRAGVDFVRARHGADPAAVVYDAIASSKARGRDAVLVDTAGRLHTRANLMAELDKIRRVAAREIEGAPHEVLLVLDATVGQNGLVQAREFMQAASVNGIVLTKLDGTAKGGIAIAIASELGVALRYVGVGEGIEDLLPFSAREYVEALFQEKW